ncbi:putative membrane protein [Prauserella sp. Am3]|nr:putative membrane protein [Prauserella sp. Am3]
MTTSPQRTGKAPAWTSYGVDVVRGALIGTAETVPGVSGGTVALVVRVYDTAITSAGHLITGAVRAVTDVPRGKGAARAATEFRSVAWRTIIPLLAGMVVALLVMARFMEGWVEDHPVQTRALFFGMVLASLWVPYSMVAGAPRSDGRMSPWTMRDILPAVVTAVVMYVVVSLPPGNVEASAPVIVIAAAIAICALVLPGLSGSFLLLTIGLYQPTLAAVNDRDFGYLGLFALGAIIGLGSIVKVLQWLLEHRKRITLVIVTGLMAGSLRALWPWQNDDRDLLAPSEDLALAIILGIVGFAVVAAVLVVEARMTRAQERTTSA